MKYPNRNKIKLVPLTKTKKTQKNHLKYPASRPWFDYLPITNLMSLGNALMKNMPVEETVMSLPIRIQDT